MTTVSTGELSNSALVALCAELFAPNAENTGVLTPKWPAFDGSKVKLQELTQDLCVAAFLGLRERGLISMSVTTQKFLGLFPSKCVAVELIKEEETPGLDGRLLKKIASHKKNYSAKKALFDALGGYDEYPRQSCMASAYYEAVKPGYMTVADDHRNLLQKFVASAPKPEPVMEKIATLKPQAEALRAKLESFRTSESELYTQLIADINGAIKDLENAATNTSYDSDY